MNKQPNAGTIEPTQDLELHQVAVFVRLLDELTDVYNISVSLQHDLSGTVAATPLTPSQIKELQALDLLSQSIADIRRILYLAVECYPEPIPCELLRHKVHLKALANRIAKPESTSVRHENSKSGIDDNPSEVDWL